MTTPSEHTPASNPSTNKRASRRRTTRRVFLGTTVLAAGGGILAYASDLFGFRRLTLWYARAGENYGRAYTYIHLPPAERVVKHFDYLTLDPDGVNRFVADYERVFGELAPRNLAANRLFYTKFLMSTDFFLNGADESRLVKYVALHHPYENPCWSPFPVTNTTA